MSKFYTRKENEKKKRIKKPIRCVLTLLNSKKKIKKSARICNKQRIYHIVKHLPSYCVTDAHAHPRNIRCKSSLELFGDHSTAWVSGCLSIGIFAVSFIYLLSFVDSDFPNMLFKSVEIRLLLINSPLKSVFFVNKIFLMTFLILVVFGKFRVKFVENLKTLGFLYKEVSLGNHCSSGMDT